MKINVQRNLYSKKYCVYSSLHIRLKTGIQSLKKKENKDMVS